MKNNNNNKKSEFVVVKQLQQIGGSLALLIPSYARHKMNFSNQSRVKITVQNNKVIIECDGS